MKEMTAQEIRSKVTKIVARLKNPAVSDFEVEVRNQFAGIEDRKSIEKILKSVKNVMSAEIVNLQKSDPLSSADYTEALEGFVSHAEALMDRLSKSDSDLENFGEDLNRKSDIRERKSYRESKVDEKASIAAVERELEMYAQELAVKKAEAMAQEKLKQDPVFQEFNAKFSEAEEEIKQAEDLEAWLANPKNTNTWTPATPDRSKPVGITNQPKPEKARAAVFIAAKDLKTPEQCKENLSVMLSRLSGQSDQAKFQALTKYREDLKEAMRNLPASDRKKPMEMLGDAIKAVSGEIAKSSEKLLQQRHSPGSRR